MRKTIGFIILLIQFSCSNPPKDDRLTFKIQYQPEKKYTLTTERTSLTILQYSGPEISLQRLKARGVQNPSISNKKIEKEFILKTGKLIDGKSFPCTVELIKTISNDGKKDISKGAIIHGQCSVGDMPVFDSVVLDGLDENYKTMLIQTMQNAFSQLSFPEKKLKMGEEFAIEYPLSIPMEGSTVEMVVSTKYKLMGISDDTASFDISQTYTMSPTMMDNSFKGTGNGKGQLLYDIVNNIALKNTLVTEIEINKRLDSFDFNLKARSGFIQTTKVSTK